MAGPWEKYVTDQAGPWTRYAPPPASERSLKDNVGDVMRSGASGIAKGATGILDLPGQIPSLAMMGGSWVGEKTGLIEPEKAQQFRERVSALGAGTGATGVATRLAPEVMGYQPETTVGEYAQTVGEFVPGTALGGNIPQMVGAGIGSEAAGRMAEGTPYETAARFGGAVAGGVAGGAIPRAITPNPADPARKAAAKTLAAEGVPLTAGQKTGNVNLQYREAMTPRTVQMLADQGDDFTGAVLKRIGVEGKRAEPEVLNAAYQRIGGVFDDLASRNQIAPDRQLVSGVNDAVRKYTQSTNKNNIAPIVENIAGKIRSALRQGKPISGAEYQQFRSDLGPLVTASDRQLATAARDLRIALDDAMERSITATGNADDIALYTTARQQYRDYLAIEGAATKAGSDTAAGILNPRQLRAEVVRVQGKRSYATGNSDLGELARAGNIAMQPLPQSGTQPRMMANTIQALSGSGAGMGAGGLTYALTKDPQLAAYAGVAGALAPAARNQMTGSRVGQAYLANQMLPGQSNTAAQMTAAALAAALAEEENRRKEQYRQ